MIIRLEIEQILGIEKAVLEPGIVNVIRGGNGVGKTSLLESVRFLFLGGNDPSLLRRGAEKGLVRATYADGKVITRSQTPKGATVDVRIPIDGVVTKVQAPQAYLSQMVGELAMDPLALLRCPEAKQAEYLADLVSPEVSDAEIREAAGVSVPRMKANGLERIAVVRKMVYDERTAVNRTAADKAATAVQLRETLPPTDAAVPDVANLRERKGAGEAAIAAAEKAAQAKRDASLEGIRTNAQGEIDSVRADAAERIREIEREREAAIARVKERAEASAIEVREMAAAEAREVAEKVRPELVALAEEIARAEEREKEHARAEKTREILATAERDAAEAKTKSAALTAALGRLDALRAKLLEQLPVKGLEIRDGQVFFEEIPLRRLNTAAQMQVALKVARLKAGKAGLIVVDHAEAFDPTNLEALKAAAAEVGLQWFLAERTEGPLDVESVQAAAEEAAA